MEHCSRLAQRTRRRQPDVSARVHSRYSSSDELAIQVWPRRTHFFSSATTASVIESASWDGGRVTGFGAAIVACVTRRACETAADAQRGPASSVKARFRAGLQLRPEDRRCRLRCVLQYNDVPGGGNPERCYVTKGRMAAADAVS